MSGTRMSGTKRDREIMRVRECVCVEYIHIYGHTIRHIIHMHANICMHWHDRENIIVYS